MVKKVVRRVSQQVVQKQKEKEQCCYVVSHPGMFLKSGSFALIFFTFQPKQVQEAD
jgi:hypothetical protein